ncbi:MAG: hypothetical protein HWN65_11520 [Candidatus Helarchaeota archaeon]|nr:hypothetical protein [Candidatus Helarchaeota archaeon]
MPGITHLLFGLMIVIPIMYMAKEKFSYKVAGIFVLNCWIGPDFQWAYRWITPGVTWPHSLFGFMIWAIPLALFYSYLSRFSFDRTNRFFTIVDDGKRDVSLKNTYLLCLAGGIFHHFIDLLFNGEPYEFHLWDGWDLSLTEINTWGELSYGLPNVLTIVGFILLVAISLFIIYYLRKEVKDALLFLFVVMSLVILIYFTLGFEAFGTEREFGAMLCLFCFIFLPLMTLGYVAINVNKNPTQPSPPLINKKLALNMIIAITLVVNVAILGLGLIGMFAPEIPSVLIDLPNEVFFILGILVISLAAIGIVGAIGLILRKNFGRNLVIFFCILLWLFIYPFAIVLFLCRDDIKEMFNKTDKAG